MSVILAPLYPALVPFIPELIEIGVNSFYYGLNNLDDSSIITRRPAFNVNNSITKHSEPNFFDKTEIALLIKNLQTNNINTYLVINEHYYNSTTSSLFEKHFGEIIRLSDAVIISNPSLFQHLKEIGSKKIIASVGTHVFNKESIKFYKNLGADTIVLPRSITTAEAIEFAIAFPELEFEYLILNDFCPFTDGLCRSFHGFPFQSVCHYATISNDIGKFKHNGCRLCNLFELLKTNNINLKIAGRGFSPEIIIKNVKILNEIRLNKDLKNKTDFQNFVKNRYISYFGNVCHLNCRKDD